MTQIVTIRLFWQKSMMFFNP